MAISNFFQTAATYNSGMRMALHRVIDVMSIIAGTSLLISIARIDQLGSKFSTIPVVLVLFSVLPSIFLRKDVQLGLRGALTATGFLIACFIGVTKLGLGSAAFMGFPFLLALSAALFSRFVTYLAFGMSIIVLLVIAALFVFGSLQPVDSSLLGWSQNPRNWFVMLCRLLISRLRVRVLQGSPIYLVYSVLCGLVAYALRAVELCRKQYGSTVNEN